MAQAYVSQTVFLAGLIIAILGSSLISVVTMTQLSTTLGLKGEKGDTGATGATGATGETGMRGNDGIDGRDGINGSQGPKGDIGPQGPAGVFTIANMSGYVSAPAYDSGWIHNLTQTTTLWHGLNTINVLISLQWEDTQQVWWRDLTQNEITLQRSTSNESLNIRVMMWKIAQP